MAESLQDLLAKYRNDSVQTNWSLYHAVRRTHPPWKINRVGSIWPNYQSNATPADFTPNGNSAHSSYVAIVAHTETAFTSPVNCEDTGSLKAIKR
jgi:hypothetical protein